MPPLAGLAMLGVSALATCCTLTDPHRPGRARVQTASLVMLAAMVDVALVGAVLPLLWAVAVVATGVWASAVHGGSSGHRRTGMQVHRGLAAVAMGALLVGHPHTGGHLHATLGPAFLVAVLCGVVVVGGALLTASGLRAAAAARERIAALEPALMAVAVSAMMVR